jgi:hypothetical protein
MAIGLQAGEVSQGNNSVAMGSFAGQLKQGNNSVAIGFSAGATSQPANSIIINATGGTLNGSSPGLYIAPVRSSAATTPVLVYDVATNEIVYNSSTRRIKKNIVDLAEDTTSVYGLRPVEYDAISDNKHYVGLIAEEAHDVDPRFAWTDEGGIPGGIDWFNIVLYTVAEMKKLRARIETLENS